MNISGIKKITCIIVLVISQVINAIKCEEDWITCGENCYSLNSTAKVTFIEAYERCRSEGAVLLTLNCKPELSFILQKIETPTSVWIQRTSIQNFTNVNDVAPEEHCAIIQLPMKHLVLKNVGCNSLFGYICQINATQSYINVDGTKNITCHPNRNKRRRRSLDLSRYPFQDRFHSPFINGMNSQPNLQFYPPRMQIFRFVTLPPPPPPFTVVPYASWRHRFPKPLQHVKGDDSSALSLHDVLMNHINSRNPSVPLNDVLEERLKKKLIPSADHSVEDYDYGLITTPSVGQQTKIGTDNISRTKNITEVDVQQDHFEQDSPMNLNNVSIVSNETNGNETKHLKTNELMTIQPTITQDNSDDSEGSFSTVKLVIQNNKSTTTKPIPTTTTTTIPTTTISKYACRDRNHFKFYGVCYYLDEASKKTWDSAKQSCSSVQSSTLASFNSRYEYESVLTIFTSAKLFDELWIGFYVDNITSSTEWDKTTVAQQSRWANGAPVMFPGWWQNQFDVSEGFCGAASKDQKKLWSLKNCQLELPYLCSYQTNAIEFYEDAPFCEFGWVSRGDYCYKYYRDLKTWREAEESCILLGGHLASIKDDADVVNLRNVLCGPICHALQGDDYHIFFIDGSHGAKLTHLLWVGYFIDPNGAIVWVDGIDSNYNNNWEMESTKRENTNQYCGQTDELTMHLSNHTCDSYLPYICQRKPGHFTNVFPIDDEAPVYCPNDKSMTWRRYGDRCYKVTMARKDNPGKSFKGAMDSCNKEGAQLASIDSHEKNYEVLSQLIHADRLNIEMWIGGMRSAEDKKFYWMNENVTLFQYVNWAKDEPNNYDKMEDCITMYPFQSGVWNDDHCSKQHGWICERSLNFSKEYTANVLYPTSGSCPSYWTKIDSKCIKFYSYKQVDFDLARFICSKNHIMGDLVSIENLKQQALITAMLANHKKSVWIGLHEIKNQFYWSDQNVPYNFTYWAKHQNSFFRTCVTLLPYGEFGKWSQTSCSANSGYICQMPVDPKLKVTNLLPFKTTCAAPYDSFTYFEEDCYTIVETAESWEMAERSCQKLGSQLASVLLVKENSFMMSQFGRFGVDEVWIGMNRSSPNEDFRWSDNWPQLFSTWGFDEPSTDEEKNCVTLSMKDGTWSTAPCEQLKFFICKKSKREIKPAVLIPYRSCKSSHWLDFGGDFCYFLEPTELMPREAAAAFCWSLGGSLVSIHTDEEMNILRKIAEYSETSIWIGLSRQEDGDFYWNDDSSSHSYLNWASGEPNDRTENCAEMLAGSGLWNDLKCNLLRKVLCKGPKVFNNKAKLPLLQENNSLSQNDTEAESNPMKIVKSDRLKAGRIIGINLGLLLLVVVVLGAGVYGYNWYRKRLITTAGGYGFDNVSYNLNNRGTTNVVLGDDPLERRYHEGDGILEDQSDDEGDDNRDQVAMEIECVKQVT